MAMASFEYTSRPPSRFRASYLVVRPLWEQLREHVQKALSNCHGALVLDVGCGHKPYYALFEGLKAVKYFGTDLPECGRREITCRLDQIPVQDDVADLVLCTQVLEHVENPEKAVGEIHRVLQPGRLALVSTHGVCVYHPGPADYWRWTHEGLGRLFRQFSSVRIVPQGGTVSCVFYLLTTWMTPFVSVRRPWLYPLRVSACLVVFLLNCLGPLLDRLSGRLKRPSSPYSLIANYLVVARK